MSTSDYVRWIGFKDITIITRRGHYSNRAYPLFHRRKRNCCLVP